MTPRFHCLLCMCVIMFMSVSFSLSAAEPCPQTSCVQAYPACLVQVNHASPTAHSLHVHCDAETSCPRVSTWHKATKWNKQATRRATNKRPSNSQTRVVAPIAQLPRIGSQMQEVWDSNPTLGGLWVSQFQASGGISALQSRASGLQSTTKGKLADKGGSPTSWRQAIHGQEHSI